jgi:hypothetical protein
MGVLFVVIIALVLIINSISELKYRHSGEIYVIWYIFFLLFLLFFLLYIFAENSGKEVTDVFGPALSGILKFIYSSLTNVDEELGLVGILVYLGVGPQLLTYILSGLSGSAIPPLFVRQIGLIAVWSVIKFLSGLSGILLANPFAKLASAKQVTIVEFVPGLLAICISFALARLQHKYFEEELELDIVPGFRVHIKTPALIEVHKYFTRHSGLPIAPENLIEVEKQLRMNTSWFVVCLRGWGFLKLYGLAMNFKIIRKATRGIIVRERQT